MPVRCRPRAMLLCQLGSASPDCAWITAVARRVAKGQNHAPLLTFTRTSVVPRDCDRTSRIVMQRTTNPKKPAAAAAGAERKPPSTASSQPKRTASSTTSARVNGTKVASASSGTSASSVTSARSVARVSSLTSGGGGGPRRAVAAPRPVFVPNDPLSRTTTPVLYMVLSHLTASEVCSAARVSRRLFDVSTAHHPVWQARCMRALASAAAPIEKDFVNARGFTVVGMAYFQRQVDSRCRLPPSLPRSSPYRHALLACLRESRATKFGQYVSRRARDPRYTSVTKPVVERLDLKFQISLNVATSSLQTELRQRGVESYMHDNAIVCAWRAEPGLAIKQIKGIQLTGFSGAVMMPIQMVSQNTRTWRSMMPSAMHDRDATR